MQLLSAISSLIYGNTPSLLDEVVDMRIRIITIGLYATFQASDAGKQEIITRKIQQLREPTKNVLKTWDETSLQEYFRWQQSPTVQKIENAINEGKLREAYQLEEVLLPEEIQALNTFKQTPVWILKTNLDTRLKPALNEVIRALKHEFSPEQYL